MGLADFLFSDPVMKLTTRNMDLLVRRSEIVSSNLANVDTPKYKAMDLDFRRVLENTIKADHVVKLARTQGMHLDGANISGGQEVIHTTSSENHRVDGNTVDMEQELLKSAEIQLMYDLAATFIKKKGGLVDMAIKDNL